MKPVSHPSNTRTLLPPANWDHDGVPVESLGITDTELQGVPCVMSFWQPEPEDLASIAAGGLIGLSIIGRTMPPALVVSLVPDVQTSGSDKPVASPVDPLDWPLPCDVQVGHGTMKKGVRLRTLVLRMKALYEMATGENADQVANRSLDQRKALFSRFFAGVSRAAAADRPKQSPTSGMTLGERIAHVGGRTNAQGYVEFGSPMAVQALIRHAIRDQAVTPAQSGQMQARANAVELVTQAVLRSRYPVSTTINPKGHSWDTSRLDETVADLASEVEFLYLSGAVRPDATWTADRASRHLLRCAIALITHVGLDEVAGQGRAAVAQQLQIMLADSWPDEPTESAQRNVNAPDATCTTCGCTDSQACAGGCSWLYVDREERTGLCSTCAPKIEPEVVMRSKEGSWYHSVLMPLPEETSFKPLLDAAGMEHTITSLFDDAPKDIVDRYDEAGDSDFSYWDLSAPAAAEGWFLFGTYDTEDGPIACWVRPVQKKAEG